MTPKKGSSAVRGAKLAVVLAVGLVMFGGGVAAGAAGAALILGRTNDAGTKPTVLTTSTTGAGLRVNDTGTGPTLLLNRSAPGTDLELRNGALRVPGSGFNGSTTAFVFQPTVTCSAGWLKIDNPYTNGDPNALIFLTPASITSGSPPWVTYLASDTGDCTGGYWYLAE